LASVYLETKSHLQAIDFLNQELTKNPSAAILHSDIAKAYEGINDIAKAKRSWDMVLKLVPETSPLAREAKKKLVESN
jgi:Tfp pilus assembly protein PilF